MTDNTEKTLKIRFRFPGGEEFEAQGTLEFIEKQRNYFLNLIGKQHPTPHQTTAEITTGSLITPSFQAPSPSSSPSKPTPSVAQEAFPAKRLWEKLFKEEGEEVLLRRKMRIEPQEAALLLLAAARVLLNKPACKALALSQMLQKSGFTNIGRLDRLLQPEVANGYLQSEGAKRGRTYQLTNAGFARAFVQAEKLAGESL